MTGRWTESPTAGRALASLAAVSRLRPSVLGRPDIFRARVAVSDALRQPTRIGENTLADWLSNAAASDVIRERRQAVDELRNEIDFREKSSRCSMPKFMTRSIRAVCASGRLLSHNPFRSGNGLPRQFLAAWRF